MIVGFRAEAMTRSEEGHKVLTVTCDLELWILLLTLVSWCILGKLTEER